jgi:3' terminal RNA ribose 2'-O-methyltransferase Hen1
MKGGLQSPPFLFSIYASLFMLITISTTHQPATDLGYLLHKHPDKVQTFSLSFGDAHVFYPVSSPETCTAALLLDINPFALTGRGRRERTAEPLADYVSDRPYAAASFLSVAFSEVFRSALNGICKDKPDAAKVEMPIDIFIPTVATRGGTSLLKRLFEPLGYTLDIQSFSFNENFPEWGESPYYSVRFSVQATLQRVLSHFYVLLPVLDNHKHYWINEQEVQKLLKHGESWLASHPEKELIATRYLSYRRVLVRSALDALLDDENPDAAEELSAQTALTEEKLEQQTAREKKGTLNDERLDTVMATLKSLGAKTVLDVGCGEGKLIKKLALESSLQKITGMDVSHHVLSRAQETLDKMHLATALRERISFLHGSLTYRDTRLIGYDAITAVEVIEHLDLSRLDAFERMVFGVAAPKAVILTTPNAEYNVKFSGLPKGKFRHRDHRFEWTRAEFQQYAAAVALRFGYAVSFHAIGDRDDSLGAPTQMAIFTKPVSN